MLTYIPTDLVKLWSKRVKTGVPFCTYLYTLILRLPSLQWKEKKKDKQKKGGHSPNSPLPSNSPTINMKLPFQAYPALTSLFYTSFGLLTFSILLDIDNIMGFSLSYYSFFLCVIALLPLLCKSQDTFTYSRATYYGSPDCLGTPSTYLNPFLFFISIHFKYCLIRYLNIVLLYVLFDH